MSLINPEFLLAGPDRQRPAPQTETTKTINLCQAHTPWQSAWLDKADAIEEWEQQ